MAYIVGYNMDEEIRRYQDIKELPEDQMTMEGVTEQSIKRLNERLNLGSLGYELNKQTKSRLFVMRKDENGAFLKWSLDQANIELGSSKFWAEAQMGGVFAYPSGSKEPVQIQASRENGSGRPLFSFSKPLSAEKLVPIAKKPNFFKRLLNRINKNWFKSEVEPYEKQVSARERMRNEIKARDEKTCQAELDKTREIEKSKEAEAREKEMNDLVAAAEERAMRTQLGIQFSEAIFEPEPKVFGTPETEERFKGRTANDEVHSRLLNRHENGKYIEGFMSAEQYNNLTQIGKDRLDLDAIKLGDSGMSVSKSDFCSLAMFTCMCNDIALKTDQEGEIARDGYDPTWHERLETVAGFSKEMADEIVAVTGTSMFTTDTFRIPPRNASGKFIKDIIDVARQRTADALNAYKNGDLEPLARLLANGVNKQAGNAAAEEKNFGQEFEGGCASSRRLIGMMNADPRLREAALKAGMEPKNLQVVEGLGKLCELDEKACQANLKLAQAAKNGEELSAEQKQQLAQDIVTAELAFQLMAKENVNKDIDKTQSIMEFTSPDLMVKPEQGEDPLDHMRNKLPEGKMWYLSAVSGILSINTVVRGKPDSITTLNSPTGMENLQKTAAELVKQQKLAEMAPEQISKALKLDSPNYGGEMKLGDKGLSIMKEMGMLDPEVTKIIQKELRNGAKEKLAPEAQQKAPEKQLETEKKVNAPEAAAPKA